MLSADSFWTSSLRSLPAGASITRILSAAINELDPGEAVAHFVRRDGNLLTVSDRAYDLHSYRRVVLLGVGKASMAMSDRMASILDTRLDEALVIPKHSPNSIPHMFERNNSRFTIQPGDHPIPGPNSLLAGDKAVRLVSSLGPQDLLICLISGGGSALMTAPVTGISLPDLQVFTSLLLRCGADIHEFNMFRRRLDKVKGGGIVKLSNGATIVSLILSDVVGDALEAIASGPTAPDPTTCSQVLSILEKYGLNDQVPPAILKVLRSSPETSGKPEPVFDRVQNLLVGSNLLAARAALSQAAAEGFHTCLLRSDLQGEARLVGEEYAATLRGLRQIQDHGRGPACFVSGGETTVKIVGDGKGGRNTELALASVTGLAGVPGVVLVALATDGEDGTTDASGAVATGDTLARASRAGLEPGPFLERNDSYSFFEKLGDLLRPGPTGTNGNDLVFLFVL